MRKLTWGLMLAALLMMGEIGACAQAQQETAQRLIPLHQEQVAPWAHICIFYDAQTKVIYMAARNGAIEVMIDAGGNPLLYEGE